MYKCFIFLIWVTSVFGLKYDYKTNIAIKSNETVIDLIDVDIYNKEYFIKYMVKTNKFGKLCVLNLYEIDMFELKLLVNPCPGDSIILANDLDMVRRLQNSRYEVSYNTIDYMAIIYNKTNGDAFDIVHDFENPFFEVENEVFSNLVKYSEQGFYADIAIDMISKILPISYINMSAYSSLCVNFICYVIWTVWTKRASREPTLLQRLFVLMIAFKIITSLSIVFYTSNIEIYRKKNILDDAIFKIFLDTTITTISNIYKTLYWFVLIMISNGWHIFVNGFGNFQPSTILSIYIFLYLFLCMDNILDISLLEKTRYVYIIYIVPFTRGEEYIVILGYNYIYFTKD
jgi:hypothetical protein